VSFSCRSCFLLSGSWCSPSEISLPTRCPASWLLCESSCSRVKVTIFAAHAFSPRSDLAPVLIPDQFSRSQIFIKSFRFGRLWIFAGPIHSSSHGQGSWSVRSRSPAAIAPVSVFPCLDFCPRELCRPVDPQVPLGLWSFVLVHVFFASPHRVLFHLVVVIFLLTSFSVLCQSPFPAQLAARDFLLRTKRDQVQSSRFGCLTKCCQALIVYLNWLQFFDFFCEWIVAGGRRSILELPD
jgi:hypothetical protein